MGKTSCMTLPGGWRRWVGAATAVVGALAVLSHREAPGSFVSLTGTAQPVRFVEPAADPPLAEAGGVWFLTVAERRLSPAERLLGMDEPEVVREEAVSRFDADGAFFDSQRLARDVATRLDPNGRVVVAHEVLGAPGLRRGDELVAVNGAPIAGVRDATAKIARAKIDGGLILTVAREATHHHVEAHPEADIPLERQPSVTFPDVGDVRGGEFHGASAGLAFALAYLDRTVGGALFAGRIVAATGVLADDHGAVAEVGSIDEKVAAAVAAGAEVIFIPQAAADDVPDGVPIPVVAVTHVRDAVRWLCSHPSTIGCGPLEPAGAASAHGWRPVPIPADDLRSEA